MLPLSSYSSSPSSSSSSSSFSSSSSSSYLCTHLLLLFPPFSPPPPPPPPTTTILLFIVDIPYVTIQVIIPTQEKQGINIVVEQGRQVLVICSVMSVSGQVSIDWSQQIGEKRVRGETETYTNTLNVCNHYVFQMQSCSSQH